MARATKADKEDGAADKAGRAKARAKAGPRDDREVRPGPAREGAAERG